MVKRFRWLVLVIGIGVPIVWLMVSGFLHREHPDSDAGPAAGRNGAETAGTMAAPELARDGIDENEVRESKRHAEGDVEKNRLPGLEKAVATQEQIVAERRKAISDVIRTQGVEYKASDPPKPVVLTAEQIEEIRKRGNPFVDAKRELEKELELLESMKQRLAEEKAGAKTGDK
jgi:hypothetical protein